MSTAISGTTLEQRRDEAVRQVLRLRPLTEIRQALRLGNADLEAVARRVRVVYPWIAAIVFGPEEDDDVGLCPGVAPYPAVPRPDHAKLLWCADSPGRGRVLTHTCACRMTWFELLSYGGTYRIRRNTVPRPDVPAVSYAGGWRRAEADDWWRRLIAGHAG